MATHAALLRGINVGGRNLVAMADLRRVASSLGHTDVATYIQSGNLVFTSPQTDTTALATALERVIADGLDVRPSVVVLTRAELAAVVKANPYPQETNPKCLHAAFSGGSMSAAEAAGVATARDRVRAAGSRDDATVVGGTLYLHTPDGLGRSALAVELARTKPSRPATMRNWATVTKLLAVLEA